MTWASIALLLLQIANKIVSYLQEQKLMDAGKDAEIARVSAAILAKTEFAKKTREKVGDMLGTDLDVLLDQLGKDD